ncbi:hypothetical protein [Lysobacter antibioticus]|uniref:hypothetical protein n=1 Tax=Lysobacter antibioticus TaxID=84531 RepID=UPI0011DFE03F|nr:hypothetical protein [Lysobacter antibioticus]
MTFLIIAGSVPAQDIHKCVRGKEISYQSEPCEAGQTHLKTWGTWPTSSEAYGRVRNPPPPRIDPDYLPRQARRARQGAGPGTVISPSTPGYSACAEMKRMRDQYLESEQGRNTSYDGRRAWNDRVYDACK